MPKVAHVINAQSETKLKRIVVIIVVLNKYHNLFSCRWILREIDNDILITVISGRIL